MGLGRQQGFSGAAVETTLTSAINSSALTFAVASVAGWPASGLPFTVTLDQGNETLQETVLVDSYSGTTVTLDTLLGRGYDGTTAQDHAEDAPVVHTLDAAWCADVSARLFVPTTKGDMVYVNTTTGVVMTRLPIGTAGYVLTVVSGVPAWSISASGVVTTAGDLIVGTGSGTVTRLGKGSNGQVLSMVSGALSWATPASPTVGLQPIDKSSSYTAASLDYAVASASLTVTSPTAAKGATFGAIANYAASNASPVTLSVATGTIIGPGIASGATSILLGTEGAFAVLTSDGTNWFVTAGAQDSGWVTPTLLNSWVTSGALPPQYRLVGNRVSLRGGLQGGTSNTEAFALPAGFRPSATAPQFTCYFAIGATGGDYPNPQVTIFAGALTPSWSAGTLSIIDLSIITYTVD